MKKTTKLLYFIQENFWERCSFSIMVHDGVEYALVNIKKEEYVCIFFQEDRNFIQDVLSKHNIYSFNRMYEKEEFIIVEKKGSLNKLSKKKK